MGGDCKDKVKVKVKVESDLLPLLRAFFFWRGERLGEGQNRYVADQAG